MPRVQEVRCAMEDGPRDARSESRGRAREAALGMGGGPYRGRGGAPSQSSRNPVLSAPSEGAELEYFGMGGAPRS